jgi:hypothetical protein
VVLSLRWYAVRLSRGCIYPMSRRFGAMWHIEHVFWYSCYPHIQELSTNEGEHALNNKCFNKSKKLALEMKNWCGFWGRLWNDFLTKSLVTGWHKGGIKKFCPNFWNEKSLEKSRFVGTITIAYSGENVNIMFWWYQGEKFQ